MSEESNGKPLDKSLSVVDVWSMGPCPLHKELLIVSYYVSILKNIEPLFKMSHETPMQSDLYAMLGSLRQLEGHLKNIQARTFEMNEEISYLISDNLRLLDSVNNQVSSTKNLHQRQC